MVPEMYLPGMKYVYVRFEKDLATPNEIFAMVRNAPNLLLMRGSDDTYVINFL